MCWSVFCNSTCLKNGSEIKTSNLYVVSKGIKGKIISEVLNKEMDKLPQAKAKKKRKGKEKKDRHGYTHINIRQNRF